MGTAMTMTILAIFMVSLTIITFIIFLVLLYAVVRIERASPSVLEEVQQNLKDKEAVFWGENDLENEVQGIAVTEDGRVVYKSSYSSRRIGNVFS